MSYVDGSDEDYGGGGQTYGDSDYSYAASANSLEFSITSSAAPTSSQPTNEVSYVAQRDATSRDKADTTTLFGNDPNQPPRLDGTKQQLDYDIQKFQQEVQADPSKLDSLKCFGPPTTPPDILDKPTWPPFPEKEQEENYPTDPSELPEKGLPRSPFFENDPRAPEWLEAI